MHSPSGEGKTYPQKEPKDNHQIYRRAEQQSSAPQESAETFLSTKRRLKKQFLALQMCPATVLIPTEQHSPAVRESSCLHPDVRAHEPSTAFANHQNLQQYNTALQSSTALITIRNHKGEDKYSPQPYRGAQTPSLGLQESMESILGTSEEHSDHLLTSSRVKKPYRKAKKMVCTIKQQLQTTLQHPSVTFQTELVTVLTTVTH
ncbi:hypothetical protein AOLI_G00199870 [Acnodon oligacanthus]